MEKRHWWTLVEKRQDEGYGAGLTQKDKAKALVIIACIALAFAVAVNFLYRPSANAAGGIATCGSYQFPNQQYSCIAYYAGETGNALACASLPAQYGPQCYSAVAANTMDISYCSMINASNQQYYGCITSLSRVSDDYAYCNVLGAQQALQCIWNFSAAGNFSGLAGCSELTNPVYSSDCMDIHYYQNAVASGNKSYCGMVSGNANKTLLSSLIEGSQSYSAGDSNMSNATVTSLLYFELNISARDLCYYRLGLCTPMVSSSGAVSCSA